MKRFTELYLSLDASNRTSVKVAALKSYFSSVSAEDGAWAVFFLTGNRLKRIVKSRDFREWAGVECAFPEWMVEECYDHVGDLAETLALLIGNRNFQNQGDARFLGKQLHEIVEEQLLPLRDLGAPEQKQKLSEIWRRMDRDSCFIFNKLITGGFRVGVSRTLVNRALAEVAGIEPAVMAHRLMGTWQPLPADFRALFEPSAVGQNPAQPYPFCLAYPLAEEMTPEKLKAELGPVQEWQIEWKWDGIRAQLIKRAGEAILWSRGEEIVVEQFPEVIEAVYLWDRSFVLDGELVAWDHGVGKPLPFGFLQKRLGRKKVGAKLRKEVPVVFMVYDILEDSGVDCRNEATEERRRRLEKSLRSIDQEVFRLSPVLNLASWEAAGKERSRAREKRVEGLMVKRKSGTYQVGRKKGDWWKWKIEPYTIDAVLVYAQQGHGRRAGLYSDYTFSVWKEGELVPFAKAYSGLSDKELNRVDRWIKAHTRDKHGPVRVVDPELVFEIAFEGISESKRHKSGVAVRFPRIKRWREDKRAEDADTIETIQELL